MESAKFKNKKVQWREQTRSHTDKKHYVSISDLQQNTYLPKSNVGESFYKHRLACYNFTVNDLASHDGYCYLSNESLTKRGANEISMYISGYLTMLDNKGVETVDLYADEHIGQNLNSVLQAMLHRVLTRFMHLKQITLHFFEKTQKAKGGWLHVKQFKEEILHSCQLSEIMQDAR